jgi:predicted CopG family antitoxin
METLTEDMKQISRDNRRLAKQLDVYSKLLKEKSETEHLAPFILDLDGEGEVITKLMRRYSTRITKGCDLLYNATYIDFHEHEEDEIDKILEEGEEDDSDDD